MSLIGEKPRPRVLMINVPEERADLVAAIASVAPTCMTVRSNQLNQIREAEWDAAVVFGNVPSLEPHVFVLAIGPDYLQVNYPAPGWIVEVNFSGASVATELALPNGMDGKLKALVECDLVPLIRAEHRHMAFRTVVRQSSISDPPMPSAAPLLLDADGAVLAGQLERNGGQSVCWFLPDGVSLLDWFLQAVRAWQKIAPDRFPEVSPWKQRTEWMTAQELGLARREEASLTSFTEAEHRRRQESDELRAASLAAASEADSTVRRMLTGTGSELVEAVTECLEVLGFRVEDVDLTKGDQANKLEDLRVHHGSDWLALAEVKGYGGGAKSNDLLKLSRFVNRYIGEVGAPPSAVWYVVNHTIEQDPGTRSKPLAGVPDDVAEFALGQGLVIDTRDLFAAWRRVDLGQIEASLVAESLMRGTAWWSPPE